MKHFALLGLALAVMASTAIAEEIKSGPQAGDKIGAFYVTKVTGAETDGVDVGKNLCYRCRNGAKPQVMVFTRSMDPKVVELLQKIDQQVSKNEDVKLRAFVNVMDADKDEAESNAKKLAEQSKASNVPFVVPNEFENGPDNYGISSKAEVTIVMARDLGVKANHSVAKAQDLDVDAVIKDLNKILN